MTDQEIYDNLCSKDRRNPLYQDTYGEWDEKPPPRSDCYCDNCFSGRDKLAVELLHARWAFSLLSQAHTEHLRACR